jgi:hypothetical protein
MATIEPKIFDELKTAFGIFWRQIFCRRRIEPFQTHG